MSKMINVTRVFTYDVESVKESIRDINNDPKLKVSDEEVWDLVSQWGLEDMVSPITRNDLIWTNEDGEEIM